MSRTSQLTHVKQLVSVALVLLLAFMLLNILPKTSGQTTNLALNKPASASSSETSSLTPNLAVDGNPATRWASQYSDPQWLQIDLGGSYTLNRVVLRWAPAIAAARPSARSTQTPADSTRWP